MASHSVAEAKNRLSELIDRALHGEGIVITRHGQPVVELKPVARQGRAVTETDLAWLRARRKGRGVATEDAGTLLSRMRDEDWR